MRGITRDERVKRRRQKGDSGNRSPSFKENIESGSRVAQLHRKGCKDSEAPRRITNLWAPLVSYRRRLSISSSSPPSLVSRKGWKRREREKGRRLNERGKDRLRNWRRRRKSGKKRNIAGQDTVQWRNGSFDVEIIEFIVLGSFEHQAAAASSFLPFLFR